MRKSALILTAAATTLVLGLCAALAAVAVVGGGLYDIAATRPHWQATHTLLETAMRQSVRWRARDIAEPALDGEPMALRGAACFQARCAQCHGAPGVARDDIGKSMQPLPDPLSDARRRWRARELHWITRHGIKMSGMPAWQHRLSEGEIWDVVAFLGRLPDLDAAAYRQWLQQAPPAPVCGTEGAASASLAPVDVQRGRQALHQYACTACHVIPGVTGARTRVGPPLAGMGSRRWIAGVLPNDQANLALWLQRTQSVKPGTAMPEMGVKPQDARDMAGYLATLR